MERNAILWSFALGCIDSLSDGQCGVDKVSGTHIGDRPLVLRPSQLCVSLGLPRSVSTVPRGFMPELWLKQEVLQLRRLPPVDECAPVSALAAPGHAFSELTCALLN